MKTVVISGASRGVGHATAIEFAASGYAVGVGYHTSQQAALTLCELISSRGGVALPLCADVADGEAVAAVVAEFERQLGHVDVLVTSAGIGLQQEFLDTSEQDWSRIFAVNLNGTANFCRAVLPGMLSRHGGAIVTVASVWGRLGASCEAAYAASKGGVIALTKSLAREHGLNGVRVNCVAPGFIDTDMTAEIDADARAAFAKNVALGRIGRPEEVARAIYFLGSGDASYINGTVLEVDGQLTDRG